MSNLTASGLERAEKCPASLILPQEPETPSLDGGRERGSAIARYLQRVPEVGAEQALAEVPHDYAEICAGIDLDTLPTHLATEVAFAYNVRTREVLELGRGIERRYADTLLAIRPATTASEWLFCTVDVLGVGEVAVLVGDHKGYQLVDHAETNLQLGMGAFCAAKFYGKDQAVVAIYRPLGGRAGSQAELDAFDLESIEARIQDIVAGVESARLLGGEAKPSAGRHCQYCPAAASCPVASLGATALAVQQQTKLDPTGQVTRENAADWYRALRAVKAWMEQKQGAVYALASQAPIDLGNGKSLGMTEKQGNEKLDPVVTYQVLLELVGERVANDAMERVAVKKKLDEALKSHGVQGRTAVAKKVWEEVRNRGGARKPIKREVGEY